MPTYQYACTACEHRFDVVQSFSESSLTECPECAGRLRKLYGSVGVVFKGSGFYRTDSRKAEKTEKAEVTASSSGSSDKSSGSSDTSSTSSADSKKTDSKKPESNSSANTTGTTSPAKIAS